MKQFDTLERPNFSMLMDHVIQAGTTCYRNSLPLLGTKSHPIFALGLKGLVR